MQTKILPARRTTGSNKINALVVCLILALLALPAYALVRASNWLDWRLLAGVPAVVSTCTFLAYRSDKRRAEAGAWRIPESTLHLAELMGGWPGGLIAQRMFRHKTAKRAYQAIFWAIVLLHQYLATDSLLGWKISTHAFQFLRAQIT